MTCVRIASPLRRPTSSYSVSLARLIADAHDGSEPGDAVAGDRGVDDGGGGDQSLELSDLDPLDRRILEDRQVVVVVDRGSEGARVSEPLGEIGAVRAAKRIQFAHGLREVGRAEQHAAGRDGELRAELWVGRGVVASCRETIASGRTARPCGRGLILCPRHPQIAVNSAQHRLD